MLQKPGKVVKCTVQGQQGQEKAIQILSFEVQESRVENLIMRLFCVTDPVATLFSVSPDFAITVTVKFQTDSKFS